MDNRQLTKISRIHANITSHKILDARDDGYGNVGSVQIRAPWGDIVTIQATHNTKQGEWYDYQFSTCYANGRLVSYTVLYIGETPAAFIPEAPEAEYAI